MATVYLARTLVVDELYRDVALKLMHPHLQAEEGSLGRQLVQEAKVAASIHHPNVVPVLEVADEPHGLYLVMEYVEGATLSALIRAARSRKMRIPPSVSGRILVDALTGLHAAHELRLSDGQPAELVHRDFSPQNLLVGTDGIARLTDFGIAKVTSRVEATATGVIKGKVGYMPPEQALGKPLDRRCDVWASGVVVWELLAQKRLFAMDEQVAALLRIVSEPAPRVRTVRPDVPQAVDDVVAWALTQKLEDRCPDASKLRDALIEAWREIGPLAEAPEVGAFVREMVGDKLEQRRSQVSEVIELRRQMSEFASQAIALNETESASLSAADQPPLPAEIPITVTPPSEAPTVALSGEQTTASSSWSRSHEEGRWRRGKAAFIATGIVLAAVGGIVVWQLVDGSEDGVPPANSAAGVVASAVSSQPEPSGAPSPPPTASADSVRRVLVVHANTPMAAVRVGKRTVGIVDPTSQLDVQLAADECDEELTIQAKTKDGRRASATAAASATSVDLEFPRIRVRPAPTLTTSKEPPGLAPTPYGK